MAVLIKPRLWGKQLPAPGSTINWGHPLAAGLWDGLLYNQGAGAPSLMVSRQQLTPASAGMNWGPRGMDQSANNQHQTVVTNRSFTSSNFSIMVRAHLRSNGNSNAAWFSQRTGTTFLFGPNIGGTPNLFMVTPSTANWASLVPPLGVEANYIGTSDSAANKAYGYIDTLSQASTTSAGTQFGAQSWALGTDTAAGGRWPPGFMAALWIWQRTLTAADVAWLADEPYAFIIPPGPSTRYFIPPGATQFNQSLAAIQTQTPGVIKSVGHGVAVTNTQAPAMVRSAGKKVNVAQAQTSTLVRQAGKVVAVAQAQSPTVVRSIGKALGFTETQTAAVTKRVGKILGFIQTQLGSLTATSVGPLRDIEYVLGASSAKWSADDPAAKWDAGPPAT